MRWLTFVLSLLLVHSCLAQSSFEQVVKACEKVQEEVALQHCAALEKAGDLSFGLYYNKGLALRNQTQFARSRASFEKALLFEPRNLKARRRLREVKERLGPQLAEKDVQGTPFWTTGEAKVLLWLSTLFLLSLGVARVVGRELSPRVTAIGALLFGLLFAVVLTQNPPRSRAVVISKNAHALEKPKSDSSGPILLEGLMVEVLSEKNHFLQIRTGDGRESWVRAGELERL